MYSNPRVCRLCSLLQLPQGAAGYAITGRHLGLGRERDETAGIPGPGWKWWNLRGLGAGGILQSVPEVKRALHPGQLHKSTLYLNLGYLGTAVTGNLQEGKIIVIISV